MGNKILRPSDIQPLSGFNDDQISYLKDKFDILCDQSKFLSSAKISQVFKCSRQQAEKVMNYIDFQSQRQVDFYQFTCAAASLHQNDDDALQFLYDLFGNGQQLNEQSFQVMFGTVFRYLKFLDKIQQDYDSEIGKKKFNQYDFNKNQRLGFQQFKSMLKNDHHCRMWMETLGFAQETPETPPQKILNQQNDDFILEDSQGDQAGSTPSWVKTVQYLTPDNKNSFKGYEQTPSSNLQIQYVYGYRCYDATNNLRYNSSGDVVYHTAACGIILNKIKNTMKINRSHTDDIICLDLNTNKNLVVTGQMGRKPAIIVWDSNTGQQKFCFKQKLQNSINNVAISKSGNFIAATSNNDNHSIAVYDLSKNALIATGNGPKSVIHALKFSNNEEELVCACQKEVVFVKFNTGKVQTKKGIFGKAPLTANYCIAIAGDAIVTGMANGVLGYWKGNVCSRVYKQHVKPVTGICQRIDGGVISGDSIGNIIIWSPNLSKEKEIQLSKILSSPSNNPRIIALCEGFGNILVGTRGGQIIQVQQKTSNATIVSQGHFDQQLWGLAVLPNKRQFITGGQDKLLLKWDGDKRKLIAKKKLDYSINSIDINKNGLLAVGYRNGVIYFYDSNKLQYIKKIQTFKNPDKDMISVVKFSPNGSTLAVGYCPPISQVYLYNVETTNKIGICKGSPSRIYSIDFSRDGNSIIVNNSSYEILFYNATNGSQITAATPFKNQQFATMTSRFSWHTQGIWPAYFDGTDINSVDRSNSKKYLVTGDDQGKVKLFKYPVFQKRQIYNPYVGHSSHITGVKWTFDDKFVISTGGLQKSVIQWILQENQQQNIQFGQQKQEVQQQQNIIDQNEQYQYELQEKVEQKKAPKQQGQFTLQQEQGDQALSIKPFLGQVEKSTPASFKALKINNSLPQKDLKIKHAWGIRNQYISDRVRNQLKYSQGYNSCIFITATLGVQMDLKTKQQKFYQGHEEDLVSFAQSKDRKYCATGQMAQLNPSQPRSKIIDIHVWDSQTKKTLAKLSGFHQRAVVVLQFSPSGKRLLTVGQDDKNSLAVYDWKSNRIAWKSTVDGAKVTGGAWKSQQQFMTVGLKHIKLWRNNKGVVCKLPGQKFDPQLSVVYWKDKFVSGGSNGSLYLWTGSTAVATKGHQGKVDCISVDTTDGSLYSGCSKGIINKWKFSGGKLVLDQRIVQMQKIDKLSPGVLSLDFSNQNMLICTNSSSIYQVQKNGKGNPLTIMQSHYEVQLWAQSWSADNTKFVTGGDDKTIRIYDPKTFQMTAIYQMEQRIRGLDWEKRKGQIIVVADYKGRIYLFDPNLNLLDKSKTKFSKTKPRKQPFWVEDIKFSPNGEYVAFGAHGGSPYISIFQIKDNKFGKQTVSETIISSAMLSVDWTQDSSTLAIISQAYQLQFINIDGKKVSATSVRQAKWATWTGKFGAYVKQIHQDVDYSNINTVDMSPSRQLIATGGDDQKIRLFRIPVINPKQKNKAFVGHSSHVTKIRFSKNQKYLLSTGGNDRTILLWNVIGPQGQQGEEQQQIKQKNENEQNIQEQANNQDADQIDIPMIRQQEEDDDGKTKKTNVDQDQFQLEEDEGDQFMAVKPWLGAIKQPTTKYYKGSGKKPNYDLILEYAHGYRTKDCRNNLIYLNENQIAYHTAGLGVVMDISKNPRDQKFFNSHTDDIISMCWNKDKSAVFTGQMGAKPIIYQWNKDGTQRGKYKGVTKGVSALGVCDKYLAASGMDDDHKIYIFQISSNKLIASQKGGRQFITELQWLDQQNFITIGIKHFKLWSLSGKSIKGKTGIFGKNCNILCSISIKGSNAYVGAADGSLQVWSGNSCTKSHKVHQKSINSLCIVNQVILTGSKDKTISILDLSSLNQLAKIDCNQLLIGSINKQIEAIDVHQNRIIVGTKGSQIYEIKSNRTVQSANQQSQFRLAGHYMSGHYAPNHVTNQVWGLALYKDKYYLSSGDDGTMRVWDIEKRQQVMIVNLDIDQKLKPRAAKPTQKFLPKSCKGNTITVAQTGQIVIGCKDGRIIVFNEKFKPILCQKISEKQISVVKISPDQNILAVGDHIGRITLLVWNRGVKKMQVKSKSIKHHSTIKNLDFSRDSNIIHSTCTSYQLLFWDVNTGKQITAGATSTRDEQWATWSLTLGWPVQGIFQKFMDGTDVNAVDRSKKNFGDNQMKLLASADDNGHVRLLQYPCIEKNSDSSVGLGHSSHVTNVLFSNDDERVFSTGGQDQTVIQWKIQ